MVPAPASTVASDALTVSYSLEMRRCSFRKDDYSLPTHDCPRIKLLQHVELAAASVSTPAMAAGSGHRGGATVPAAAQRDSVDGRFDIGCRSSDQSPSTCPLLRDRSRACCRIKPNCLTRRAPRYGGRPGGVHQGLRTGYARSNQDHLEDGQVPYAVPSNGFANYVRAHCGPTHRRELHAYLSM
jgi:hypothetical protein